MNHHICEDQEEMLVSLETASDLCGADEGLAEFQSRHRSGTTEKLRETGFPADVSSELPDTEGLA